MPFLALVEPLVGWVHAQLTACLPAGNERMPAATRWAELVLPELCRRLNGMAQRTCLAELAAARSAERLAGDSGEARFATFLDWLSANDGDVLARHPVLTRQLLVVCRLWLAHAVEFATRTANDLPLLVDRFSGGREPGAVSDVVMGLGDPHRGARTVCLLRFENGLRCVYKPRSLSVDEHFRDLVRWLGERVDGPAPVAVDCLDRGDYGWAEFVEARDCAPGPAAARLFRRYGGLLAVLYLVHASDCHVENVVIAGELPFLVDVETVCQPRIPSLGRESRSAAERVAGERCADSVLFSGLLPIGRSADATELAGVGSSAVTPRPGAGMVHAVVEDAGTDRMRIAVTPRAPERARVSALPRPVDHLADLEAGFAEAYRVLVRHRDEVAGLLAAFAGDRVRYVPRETAVYGMLLSTSFHPSLLADDAVRERHFDRLRGAVGRRPGLAAFVDAERQALWRNDIPFFVVGADAGPVRADDERLDVVTVHSGLSVAREVLARLGPADLELQTWLIRTAVTAETIRSELTVTRAAHDSPLAAAPASPGRLADAADTVAERVAALATEADGEAVWLGCSTGRSGNYAVGMLGGGLYDGQLGIAVFLANHARLRDSRESARLATAAGRAALRRIARGDELANGVGLRGAGGLVYGLAHLHALRPDPGLLDTALAVAERVRAEVAADEQFEVMSGAAGAILGLAALYRIRPDGVVRDAIAAAAGRLAATRRQYAVGIGWTPELLGELGVATEPIGGFAHGSAGIAAALAVAADVLGEPAHAELAGAALAYENGLFDTALGDWRDVRANTDTELVVAQGKSARAVAWCHGAPGIGVGRDVVLDVLDEPAWRTDLATAAGITARSGFGSDHSLCHGDLGNLDFLLLAARRDTTLAELVRRRATGVLDGVEEHGWRCGLHPNLVAAGLFTGLAGIGYGLLRLLRPDTVPSIVALHPPNAGAST